MKPLPALPQVAPSPVRAAGIEFFHTGPGIEAGPLPAFFYFALDGEQTLSLDPFNQPAAFLSSAPLRVFSCSIPFHRADCSPVDAFKQWIDSIAAGEDFVTPFIEGVMRGVDALLAEGWIEEGFLAVGGLSRGGFLATHLAAMDLRFSAVVGFAPLTELTYHTEFADLTDSPLANSLSLFHLTDRLIHTSLRFYIGNYDKKVGTECSFRFVEKLTEAAYQARVRSPAVELLITPSVGYKGHGTPPHLFFDGAEWIREQITSNTPEGSPTGSKD